MVFILYSYFVLFDRCAFASQDALPAKRNCEVCGITEGTVLKARCGWLLHCVSAHSKPVQYGDLGVESLGLILFNNYKLKCEIL